MDSRRARALILPVALVLLLVALLASTQAGAASTLTFRPVFLKTTLHATDDGYLKVPIKNPNTVKADGHLGLTGGKGAPAGQKDFTIAAQTEKKVKVRLSTAVRDGLAKHGEVIVNAKAVLSHNGVTQGATATLTIKPPKS